MPEQVLWSAFPPGHREHIAHRKRYTFAAVFAQGNVIDAACGYGCGSALLARAPRVTKVHGYDRNETALWHARALYASPRLMFTMADLESLSLPACDTVVTIETVEHLADPAAFIQRAKLAAERIVLSTPIVPTKGTNRWHLHDFTGGDVRSWFAGWRELGAQTQDGKYFVGAWEVKR